MSTIGASNLPSPLGNGSTELLSRMHAAQGDWPSLLSFLDSDRGVARLAEQTLRDGTIDGEDALALVAEAKDFGGITAAEEQVLRGLLEDHEERFTAEASAALRAFLGMEPQAPLHPRTPPDPTPSAPTPSSGGELGNTGAGVLASRLEERLDRTETTDTSIGRNAGVRFEPAAETQSTRIGRILAEGGNRYLNARTQGHRRAIEETGVGLYYGDHSSFGSLSAAERRQWVASSATPGTNPPTPRESSCIGWAMENLGAAYEAAGMADRWDEIRKIVVAKGSKGTDLAKELKKDGWQAIYFNPDTKHPEDGDAEHSYTARMVAKGKPYYGIEVDAMVTNYRPTPGAGTELDLSGYEKLKNIPFFFGLARGGMHTFVGQNGRVNEFHWTAEPDDPGAIEERPLPEFPWNSGVILVPPGTWPIDSE